MSARSCLALLLSAAASTSACGDDDDPSGGGARGSATVFAVATDFSTTGIASTIAIPDLAVTRNAVAGVALVDPVVRRLGDRLFIVNRLGNDGDNVTVLDADRLSLVAQISTGVGSNPQDVAVLGNIMYVVGLAATGVLVLDLDRPDAGVIDTIDLSDLDPEDRLPDCGSIVAMGEQLVAICGILDQRFSPRGPGVAAVIDGARRTVVDRVPLAHVRPFGLAQAASAEPVVLVPTVDDFAAPASGGCVERVLLASGGARSGGCLVENAGLGGFVSALAPDAGNDRLWMTIVSSFDPDDLGPRGELVSVPAAGGEIQRHELAEGARPMDVALCPTGHLAVSDATQGVRVLGPLASSELTGGPIDIGLPPVANGLVCF